MKKPRPALLITGLLLAGSVLSCFSQNNPNECASARAHSAQDGAPAAAVESLSMNYLLTFSAVAEGKSLGELTLLTCSPQVSVAGPLDRGAAPTTFMVAGTLAEKDADLMFSYKIDFSYPVATAAAIPAPNNNMPLPGKDNKQYQQHSSQGMLRMKPGTPYEVLKAAGVVSTITISAPPKK